MAAAASVIKRPMDVWACGPVGLINKMELYGHKDENSLG